MGNFKFFKYALLATMFINIVACDKLDIRSVASATAAPSCNNLVPFDGGDGTTANPYQVCSKAQLDNVRNYLSSNFIQTTDIDITQADCVSFAPIGSVTPYSGTYDGGNYQIKNFCYHNTAAASPVGLFSQLTGTIKNVFLVNASVQGNLKVGGLIGSTNTATITSSHISGSVSGSGNVGGLVGYADTSTITDVYSSSSVTNTGANTGGLIGTLRNVSTLLRAFSTGAVTGAVNYTGGLIGLTTTSNTAVNTLSITDVFATGSVTGINKVGGLIGGATYGSVITRTFSTGAVTGIDYVAGIVGIADIVPGPGADVFMTQAYTSSNVTGTTHVDAAVYDNDAPGNQVMGGIYYLNTGVPASVSYTSITAIQLILQGTYGAFNFVIPRWKMSNTGLPFKSPIQNWACTSTLASGAGFTCQ